MNIRMYLYEKNTNMIKICVQKKYANMLKYLNIYHTPDPSYLVQVADGHRGKVNLFEGPRGVTDRDDWTLLEK